MRIGLTGGIASGKTTVSRRLAELGAAVLDADAFARIAVEKGSEGLKEIVKAFGGGMLDSDGCLDRRKLGAAVFGDEAVRLRLNGILHPAVRAGMLRAAEAAEESGFRVIVFDVPLLIECGWQEIAVGMAGDGPDGRTHTPHNGQGRVKRSGGKAAHCLPDERRRKEALCRRDNRQQRRY